MTGSLLTARDVAAILDVGVDWVYAETRANRIPHVRLGRNRRYRRASIEQWLLDLEAETLLAPTERPALRKQPGAWQQEVSPDAAQP